ncbi:MAG TPA: intradiol ring-cleavage dioxygenase [Vicinamibacterales bacterium]|nr:intradiol ring-cleavage dioxygenase [Vicinamibacterales bacterium]
MRNDDEMVGRLLTRRELVALFGAAAAATLSARPAAQAPSGLPVPACVVQPQQTEGPYFVDEMLLRSDIRSDPATGAVKPGAPLAVTVVVSEVSSGGTCTPIRNAQVDLWQCDAAGMYSDVQDRTFDTVGQKFLRGHQITDASGKVNFVTIYPGWYPGRAVHIHFKVRTPAEAGRGHEFTSQFYFEESLSDAVFAREPYSAHAGQRTLNTRDRIYQGGGSELMLPVTQSGTGYAATFNLGIRTS